MKVLNSDHTPGAAAWAAETSTAAPTPVFFCALRYHGCTAESIFIFLSFRYPFLPCRPHHCAAFKATCAFYCTKQQLFFFCRRTPAVRHRGQFPPGDACRRRLSHGAVFLLHPVCPLHFDVRWRNREMLSSLWLRGFKWLNNVQLAALYLEAAPSAITHRLSA